jgi:hypothetical protein
MIAFPGSDTETRCAILEWIIPSPPCLANQRDAKQMQAYNEMLQRNSLDKVSSPIDQAYPLINRDNEFLSAEGQDSIWMAISGLGHFPRYVARFVKCLEVCFTQGSQRYFADYICEFETWAWLAFNYEEGAKGHPLSLLEMLSHRELTDVMHILIDKFIPWCARVSFDRIFVTRMATSIVFFHFHDCITSLQQRLDAYFTQQLETVLLPYFSKGIISLIATCFGRVS